MRTYKMVDQIAPVAASVATSYTNKKVVTHIYDSDQEGRHKVVQDVYLTTVYDAQGRISAVTTAHSIDYLV